MSKVKVLSKKEGLGCIAMCHGCDDVHVALQNVTLKISQKDFIALAELFQKSLRDPQFVQLQNSPAMFQAERLFSYA